ncbi:MAG: hypothetical protein HFE73_00600 [Firmicutes bacterium]|nr:hypothetical protein [Bacillota bacterium]
MLLPAESETGLVTEKDLQDLRLMELKKYSYLSEVMDLSRQIEEAMGRNDQVSIRMLIAMREEPILRLQEVERNLKTRRQEFSQKEQQKVTDLISGEMAPELDVEKDFVEQVTINRRLIEKVVDLDQKISVRLAGDKSFYQK